MTKTNNDMGFIPISLFFIDLSQNNNYCCLMSKEVLLYQIGYMILLVKVVMIIIGF